MQPSLFPMPQEDRTSDDYWTPKWIFDALGLIFDLDVACPPGGPVHTPALHYYTQETDGLASPWSGRVWMNPPYSNTTPWVLKFQQHANGIALLQTAKSRWYNTLWNDPANKFVALPSTFRFDQGPIFMPTVLVAYGDDNIKAISKLGMPR